MMHLLAGDIGGTKTILWLLQADEERVILHEAQYASQSFPDLVPMVRQFLSDAPPVQLAIACFAIAGPVINNTSTLPNLGWSLDVKRLAADLHLSTVLLVNDFEAVGHGVLGLQPNDLHVLQNGEPIPQAPIAVIGAGTGLGQGFLVHDGQQYQVFSSEGGHADFAPRSPLEFDLSRYLIEKHNIARISVERVVSGPGIVSIYQFLRDRQFGLPSLAVDTAVRTWESQIGRSEKTVDPAAVIAQAALKGDDGLSEQTMRMFVDAYGAEAGNLALKLLPYGGLYIAGGIAAKILPLMQDGLFLQAFRHKGRMSDLLERIPVYIVLNPQVGLIGAALRAERLGLNQPQSQASPS
jgi:glucokinase